jgi:hypothetical protein
MYLPGGAVNFWSQQSPGRKELKFRFSFMTYFLTNSNDYTPKFRQSFPVFSFLQRPQLMVKLKMIELFHGLHYSYPAHCYLNLLNYL